MSIRTASKLAARLDRSLAWRKKELTQQKLLADSAEAGNAGVLRRSGLTLMYSHWEGFIKEASDSYLKYLSTKTLDLATLRSCFVAVAMREAIKSAGQSGKTSAHARLVEQFRMMETPPCIQKLPIAGVIATRSNLKAEVLREITATLGLDYSPYQLKERVVIDRLVKLRNAVAHGQGIQVSAEEYGMLHAEVISLLDLFKEQVTDAATFERHLRS